MVRLLVACSLLAFIAASLACGYVAVSGAIPPGTQTVSGMVTVVQFTFVNGTSSLTIVTLADANMAQTLNFCGDQRAQFPVNQIVHASFMPGAQCDSLMSVQMQ